MGVPDGEERKEQKKYLKQQWLIISPKHCHTPNHRFGSSQNTTQEKNAKKLYLGISFSKYIKSKIKKKSSFNYHSL